ncbi:MAG: FAD-dependent oxidoreductase [Kiloniellales bacterium]
MAQDQGFDVIVLGGGAAGMTAALVAALEGLSVCLLEREPLLGGTTAWSGGMVWAPCSDLARQAGFQDDPAAVRSYLAGLVPGLDDNPRMTAFLTAAPEAVDYLARRSQVRLQPVARYPDYYPDRAGASLAGRVLEPEPFQAAVLGRDLRLLRPPLPEFSLFGGMMIARPDIPHFRHPFRALRSSRVVASYLLRYAGQRLRYGRGTSLVLGNALVARLLVSLRDAGVTIRVSTKVVALTQDPSGRVTGVVCEDGSQCAAARGVVLATGGFGHERQRRAALLPPALLANSATAEGALGEGLGLAEAVGARLASGKAGNAFLAPVSRYRRADGSLAVYPHTVTDRAKPGLIAVDDLGRRFANEAVSYHAFATALLARQNISRDAGAWLICDSTFLQRYGMGAIKPKTRRLGAFLAQGYLRRAATPAGLAAALDLPLEPFLETLEAYNTAARRGEDPDFGRGGDAYQRFLGDAAVAPNPCLAPIEHAPYYALRVLPGDLGTAAGLDTDPVGRVLDAGGAAIPGLYCCGADMASVMEGAYPGPGITLGPALAFGYLIGRSLAMS